MMIRTKTDDCQISPTIHESVCAATVQYYAYFMRLSDLPLAHGSRTIARCECETPYRGTGLISSRNCSILQNQVKFHKPSFSAKTTPGISKDFAIPLNNVSDVLLLTLNDLCVIDSTLNDVCTCVSCSLTSVVCILFLSTGPKRHQL